MCRKIELFMDKWLLRYGNPTRSENISVLSLSAEELSVAPNPSWPEVEGSYEAHSHSQYVEVINFLYSFTTTLG